MAYTEWFALQVGKVLYHSPDDETFDTWGFYYGRITRILPVYVATWLFALALTPLGHNHDSGNLKNAIWGGFASVYGIQACQISH